MSEELRSVMALDFLCWWFPAFLAVGCYWDSPSYPDRQSEACWVLAILIFGWLIFPALALWAGAYAVRLAVRLVMLPYQLVRDALPKRKPRSALDGRSDR